MASIKVAVRVRPLNTREKTLGAHCIIEMEGNTTKIVNLKASSSVTGEVSTRDNMKTFTYDYSYWTADRLSRNYVPQQQVFQDIGEELLKSAFEGYNACIFAYGQTGSGKTYTMMGTPDNTGLIPRISEALYARMRKNMDDNERTSYRTEVSYLEIYQERVRDLLRPPSKGRGNVQHSLRVREHPKDGPYVQDLTKHLVSDFAAIESLMEQGSSVRVTASTGMNDVSSRSHAIFTVNFTQAKFDHELPSETISKIHLVDLAGSERADATGATGTRLKEGGNINKSLVTLGNVISTLADLSTAIHTGKKVFIPYRDSVLTWLLKDSLGGNSKTIMIATISPADVNYAETLSTLRYANRAKNIINKPKVNEDPNVKLIRDLRAEIEKLKSLIQPELMGEAEKAAAKKLSENEARVEELTGKWKERWKETQKILMEREMGLRREGAGIKMDSELPHLVLVDDDLLSTGIVVYHLKEGKTVVGRGENVEGHKENKITDRTKQDIVIGGPAVNSPHCILENKNGNVLLNPLNSLCNINGNLITKLIKLYQGDVVLLGKSNLFRFYHPAQAAELREKRKSSAHGMTPLALATKFRSESDLLRGFSPGNETREEWLSKQLEEARILLDKQKQEELSKIEAARMELTKQIQEESHRLEETRGELVRTQKMRIMETQEVEETRKHIQELEHKHQQTESERQLKEQEMMKEIEIKQTQIEIHKNHLEKLQLEYHQSKEKAEKEIRKLRQDLRNHKEEEAVRFNEELKRVLEQQATNKGIQEDVDRENMKKKWDEETAQIENEKAMVQKLEKEFYEKEKLLDSEMEGVMIEKELVEKEREEVRKELDKASKKVEKMKQEREKLLEDTYKDIRQQRELLDLEIQETRKEMDDKRQGFEEKTFDLQCAQDVAAERLSQAEMNLQLKTAEENDKISHARKLLRQVEQDVMQNTKSAQMEIDKKRIEFKKENATRLEEIAKENSALKNLEEELRRMTQDLDLKTGDERDELEASLESQTQKIEDKKNEVTKLAEEQNQLEESHDSELWQFLEQIKEANEEKLESERKKLEEMEEERQSNLQMLKYEVSESKEELEMRKKRLQQNKRQLSSLDHREAEVYNKQENKLIQISEIIEKDLQEQGLQDEVYNLKDHKIKLKESGIGVKLELAEKQELFTHQSEDMLAESRRLNAELLDLERAKENTESDLKELKLDFVRTREQEKAKVYGIIDSFKGSSDNLKFSPGKELKEEMKILAEADEAKDIAMFEEEKKRFKLEMERKIQEMEEKMTGEIKSAKMEQQETVERLENQKEELEVEKQELELEMQREKVQLDKERRELEKEKTEEIDVLMREKDNEIDDIKDKANKEIDQLRERLEDADREVVVLQEKLFKWQSMATLPSFGDPLDDNEVLGYMYDKDATDRYASTGNLSLLSESMTPLNITPPPTPVNRFLESVSHFKRSQIYVAIPRYLMRGLGRDAYHVFEVKITVGDESWSVFRRYRKFRELHSTLRKIYPEVGSLHFPQRRWFGNKSDSFVRARRANLEMYLKALIALISNLPESPLSPINGREVTKRDICEFSPFFKQGIFEQPKNCSG